MTRKAGFFHRDEDRLGCPECGFIAEHIPGDWLDSHIGSSMLCGYCSLPSRIPTREESDWKFKKHPADSRFMIPIPEREGERLPVGAD